MQNSLDFIKCPKMLTFHPDHLCKLQGSPLGPGVDRRSWAPAPLWRHVDLGVSLPLLTPVPCLWKEDYALRGHLQGSGRKQVGGPAEDLGARAPSAELAPVRTEVVTKSEATVPSVPIPCLQEPGKTLGIAHRAGEPESRTGRGAPRMSTPHSPEPVSVGKERGRGGRAEGLPRIISCRLGGRRKGPWAMACGRPAGAGRGPGASGRSQP